MNIFYCITFFHHGAGRALLDLAKEMVKRGHQAVIAATAKIDQFESQSDLIAEAEKAGIPVLLCRDLFTRDFRAVSASAGQITECFRQKPFDLIHSHAAVPGFAATLSAKQAYGRFLPHISTCHAWGPNKADWMKLQDVLFLRSVDRVHAVSCDVAQYLQAEGVSPHLIQVIYNGCDFQRIDRLVKEPVDYSLQKKDKYRVGTVANLAERKGIAYLVEAVAKIPEKYLSGMDFFIVGDGDQRADLQNKANALNIGHYVRFIGYDANPYRYMKDFDLFVLPSLSEGLPVSLVEAMYLGIPVLTTDVQGNREIAGQGRGIVVPAQNSDVLAREIINAYETRLRPLDTVYDWVTRNFDRQYCFDQMFALYEKVLERGARH